MSSENVKFKFCDLVVILHEITKKRNECVKEKIKRRELWTETEDWKDVILF